MDRNAALALIQSLGFDAMFLAAGRTSADENAGYKPVLDRAFAAYTIKKGDTTPRTAVDDADTYGFQFLLQALSYDLLLPWYARMVDASVDAPLTSAKLSQQYRNMRDLRDEAWNNAALYGYVAASNMSGMRVSLDFLEPNADAGSEYG